jgi:hypothetical protein
LLMNGVGKQAFSPLNVPKSLTLKNASICYNDGGYYYFRSLDSGSGRV